MKRMLYALTTACLLAFLFVTPLVIYSQLETGSSEVLNRPIKVAELDNANIRDALTKALIGAKVPGGVIVNHHCGGFQSYSLAPETPTLRGLLDAAVAADPEYSWTIDNGSVNFGPRYNEPLFLNGVISSLEIHKAQTVNEALDRLLMLPEVSKMARSELGLRTVSGHAYAFPVDGAKLATNSISLSLKNITVREALNALARAHGNAVWILVNQEQCAATTGRKYFSLQFIGE